MIAMTMSVGGLRQDPRAERGGACEDGTGCSPSTGRRKSEGKFRSWSWFPEKPLAEVRVTFMALHRLSQFLDGYVTRTRSPEQYDYLKRIVVGGLVVEQEVDTPSHRIGDQLLAQALHSLHYPIEAADRPPDQQAS